MIYLHTKNKVFRSRVS